MGNFTIGEAWSYAVDFFQRNRTMLLVIVGGMSAIGAISQVLIVGDTTSLQQTIGHDIETGNIRNLIPAFQSVFLASVVASLFQGVGQFTGLRMGLSDEKDVNTAVIYGIGATVITFLFWGVVLLGFALVLGLLFGLLGSGSPTAMIGTMMVFILLLIPVAIWLGARLWVIQPAMAAARSMNPIYGITRSWALTASSQWQIVGYLLLVGVVMFVFMMVASMIELLLISIGGVIVGGILSGLVMSVPLAIFGVIVSAGVFRALLPPAPADVFE